MSAYTAAFVFPAVDAGTVTDPLIEKLAGTAVFVIVAIETGKNCPPTS